jgi:DNA anti-recombination protein RmuC
MAFEPDILINTPDGRVMVIEAKVAINDFPRTELALKQYMVDMQYPFGLLATPEKVRV